MHFHAMSLPHPLGEFHAGQGVVRRELLLDEVEDLRGQLLVVVF